MPTLYGLRPRPLRGNGRFAPQIRKYMDPLRWGIEMRNTKQRAPQIECYFKSKTYLLINDHDFNTY